MTRRLERRVKELEQKGGSDDCRIIIYDPADRESMRRLALEANKAGVKTAILIPDNGR